VSAAPALHGTRLDRACSSGKLWATSRIEFPPDLYPTLLSVWRAGARGARHGAQAKAARPQGGRGRHPAQTAGGRAGVRRGAFNADDGLSREELYPVAQRVKELSHGLTRDRAFAGERYLSDPELLGAYLLHFWPVSYAQARLCLGMALRSRGGAPPASALDLGAGPGPMSFALLDAGVGSVLACDRSGAALNLAERLAAELGRELRTRQWDAMKGAGMPAGPFDIITLGHTLNELWSGHPDRIALRVAFLERCAAQLAPGGRILIVEPALMKTAQEAIQVRDGLAAAGFAIQMPCIWQAGCPALPDGTCHGEFDWKPPAEMVRLAHAARIGRETLKMAWFVVGRDAAAAPDTASPAADASGTGAPTAPPPPDGGRYRVVSDPLLSKSGRIRMLVCGPMGRFALSAPKACPAPDVKPFFLLKRGDLIRFTGARRRETGWGLDGESRVEVVERAPRIW
jgi:SAM-dependent methyltransferase